MHALLQVRSSRCRNRLAQDEGTYKAHGDNTALDVALVEILGELAMAQATAKQERQEGEEHLLMAHAAIPGPGFSGQLRKEGTKSA